MVVVSPWFEISKLGLVEQKVHGTIRGDKFLNTPQKSDCPGKRGTVVLFDWGVLCKTHIKSNSYSVKFGVGFGLINDPNKNEKYL